MKTAYQNDDHLECSADGNPFPNYEWKDIVTNRTIDGSVLTIDNYLKPYKNHTFRCTAYNTVAGFRNELSETITFSVISKKYIIDNRFI